MFSVVSHYGFFPCCIYILKDMSYLSWYNHIITYSTWSRWIVSSSQNNCHKQFRCLKYVLCLLGIWVFMDCIHGDLSLCCVCVPSHCPILVITYVIKLWLYSQMWKPMSPNACWGDQFPYSTLLTCVIIERAVEYSLGYYLEINFRHTSIPVCLTSIPT